MIWPYAYTPYIWPMLASAIFLAGLAAYAWRHRNVPCAVPFMANMFFDALWALFTAVGIAATTLDVKVLFFKLEALAGVMSMNALFWFALEYASPGKWTTRGNVVRLSLASIFLMVLIATDALHHLLWVRFWFDGFVRIQRGPLNLLLVGYCILLPILSLLIFLRVAWQSRGIHRRQALLLFTGNLLPLLSFGLEVAGVDPIAPLDPLILILNVTGVLFMLAIFRFRLFDAVPVGRDMAIERMADGVLILDAENRIVDLNPAATQVLTLARKTTVGYPAVDVLAPFPDLIGLLTQEMAAGVEISLNSTEESRRFLVHVSPLTHPRGFKLGRLVLLQDVTELEQARERLTQQQRALATQQERERIARELHDSLSQELAFMNVQAQTVHELLASGATQQADDCVLRLASVARQSQADARDLMSGLMTFISPDEGFVPSLQRFLGQFCQTYRVETELSLDDQIDFPAIPLPVAAQLMRIVQEALTNVRKHAQAQHARVELHTNAEQVEVVIKDDGIGFDQTELDDEYGHYGLRIMRERAAAIGATIQFHSTLGRGTRVTLRIPLTPCPFVSMSFEGESYASAAG